MTVIAGLDEWLQELDKTQPQSGRHHHGHRAYIPISAEQKRTNTETTLALALQHQPRLARYVKVLEGFLP